MENKIRDLITPLIRDMGFELEDIGLKKMGRKYLLRVFIDKDGGVNLDDCANISREIGTVLEVEDQIPYSYTLEVSSPGLDRALKKPGDFIKFIGKTARVVTSCPIDDQTFFVGVIAEAGDTGLVLFLPKDKKVTMQYADISRARLEVII